MDQLRDGGDDPGWFSARTLLWALFPALGLRRAQASGEMTPLQMFRLLFTSFVVALGLIGVVVVVLASTGTQDDDSFSALPVAAGVAGFGLLGLVLSRLVDPPLDCSTEATLVSSYRTRLFLRVAVAEAAALVGFVGFFLSGEAWMYPLGAVFTALGFGRAAPSRRNLERDQETLNQQGCGLALIRVLSMGGSERA